MQLHEVFLIVEDAPANPQIKPGDVLDRAFGDQIGVKLGADPVDQAAQLGAVILGQHLVDIVRPAGIAEILGQDLVLVLRFQHQSGAHDDRLDVVIEQHRDQRILKAGDDNRLIMERIFRAAHPGDVGAQPAFLLLVDIIDDQHLEIGARHGACLG